MVEGLEELQATDEHKVEVPEELRATDEVEGSEDLRATDEHEVEIPDELQAAGYIHAESAPSPDPPS